MCGGGYREDLDDETVHQLQKNKKSVAQQQSVVTTTTTTTTTITTTTTTTSTEAPASTTTHAPMKDAKSFHVATVEEDEDEAEFEEVQEEYKNKVVSIKVTQAPGFLCHITATARIPLPPKVMWEQCIVHPDNASIYRHMDRCTFRKLLSDDQAGHRHLEVAHEASWRLVAFSGNFTTYLDVHEDTSREKYNEYIMKFDFINKGNSVLKDFRGVWHIQPDPHNPNGSISTLEQDIQVKVWMPPPLDKILKSISCRQVRRIFEDLMAEADKINAGKGTLGLYEEVKDKEIGYE